MYRIRDKSSIPNLSNIHTRIMCKTAFCLDLKSIKYNWVCDSNIFYKECCCYQDKTQFSIQHIMHFVYIDCNSLFEYHKVNTIKERLIHMINCMYYKKTDCCRRRKMVLLFNNSCTKYSWKLNYKKDIIMSYKPHMYLHRDSLNN